MRTLKIASGIHIYTEAIEMVKGDCDVAIFSWQDTTRFEVCHLICRDQEVANLIRVAGFILAADLEGLPRFYSPQSEYEVVEILRVHFKVELKPATED